MHMVTFRSTSITREREHTCFIGTRVSCRYGYSTPAARTSLSTVSASRPNAARVALTGRYIQFLQPRERGGVRLQDCIVVLRAGSIHYEMEVG